MEGEIPRNLKNNGERITNGRNGSLTIGTSPRSSTRNVGTGGQNRSGERFESSRSVLPLFLLDRVEESQTDQSNTEVRHAPQYIERPPATMEADLNSTLAENCDLADRLKASNKECKHLYEQAMEVQKKLDEAQRDLNDAQDFILSLQRTEQKLTESEATKDFNSLCMSVEDWVQTKLGEAIDKRLIKNEATISGPSTRKLLSYLLEPGKEAFQYPDTDEYNVTAAIMRFLFIEIFNREFYCPIDPGAMELLTSIERSMRNGRDLIAWRSWRSETFTAISKRHEFSRQRQIHCENLSTELTSMLAIFLPRSDIRKLQFTIQSIIIEPALQLAHRMHLSVNEFSLVYTHLARSKREKRRPLPPDSSPFDCVTVSPPWKVLRFPVPEGNVTYLFDLCPGLVFRAVKTSSFAEARVLKRARVLVAVYKDGDVGQRAASQPLREPLNLLGWMHESVYPQPTTLKGRLFRK